MTAPHHGSGPSMVLLCARLPSVSVRCFESVHPSPGQRDQRWREGKLKAQACYAANLVSTEQRGRRHRIFHPIFQKSVNVSTGPKRPNLTSSCFTASVSSKLVAWVVAKVAKVA
jgi:hypothetical protein